MPKICMCEKIVDSKLNFIFKLVLKTFMIITKNDQNHHMEDKREGQRKAKRCEAHKNQRRERASLFRDRKLFHP
jgi:hypothetical protein